MAGVLVFDIETVPDADLVPREEQGGFPKIPFNRVVMVGAASLAEAAPSEYRFAGLTLLSGAEREILERFWRLAEGKRLVSFNGRTFDLPVLEARSLRHGLTVPWYFADRSVRDDRSLHLDLLEFLSNGEPRNRAKLDEWCKLVGLPGKMGVDGGQVAELVGAGRFEELAAYCTTDVLQTLGLFLRVQRLRGAVAEGAFVETLRGVRDAIEQRAGERLGLEGERLHAFLRQSEAFWAA